MDTGILNLFECGKRLNLKNQVIASAAIYYHKFFKKLRLQQSIKSDKFNVDPNLIACTSLYLAAKVEESPVKCRELLCTFNEIINRIGELNFNKFEKLSKSVMTCEMIICQFIDFELNNTLPHKSLLYYLRSLNEWLFDDQNQSVQFSNLCWSLLIDFYKSPDSISDQTFKPEEISIAIIQIAIRVFKDKLEQSLDELLDCANKLYDHLDKDNLSKINLIIMNTFHFN